MIVADLAHTARYGTVRLAVLLLYVLASTTIGFAHRFAMPAAPIDLAQFALPDGTLPFICRQNGSDGGESSGSGVPFCAACNLISAPGLVPPSSAVLPRQIASTTLARLPRQERVKRPRTVATLGARGPPIA